MASGQPTPDVTELLRAWSEGQQDALDQLFPLVYDELRRLAHGRLQGERPGHTLQTTALVHEAYLRLVGTTDVEWNSRAQFFSLAGKVMRHVLVDAARARRAAKRGGGAIHLPLDDAVSPTPDGSPDLVELDDALNALAELDERKMKVVELRYFVGLTVDETARVLSVSPDTVTRDWRMAKLWLVRELRRRASDAL